MFTDPQAAAGSMDRMTRTITIAMLAGQASLNAALVWAALGPAMVIGASAALLGRKPPG
jgi:hypothetical protein